MIDQTNQDKNVNDQTQLVHNDKSSEAEVKHVKNKNNATFADLHQIEDEKNFQGSLKFDKIKSEFDAGIGQMDLKKQFQSAPEHQQTMGLRKKGTFFNPKKPFFDIDIAYIHERASRVYKEVLKQQAFQPNYHAEAQDICPCCCQVVQTDDQLIDLYKSSREDIAHLGPTYPLYFQFMKYSMGFIVIILIISGIYNLVENHNGTRCELLDELNKESNSANCSQSFITEYAGSNRLLDSPDYGQSVLNLITCIVLMSYCTIFRYRQMKTERKIDSYDISVSDYTLFINKIPQNKKRKDIEEFIHQQVPGVKVIKIVQAFKLQEYNKLNALLLDGSKRQKIEKEQIRDKIDKFEKQCFKEDNIHEVFAGAAFVSFEKEEQAVKVEQHFFLPYLKRAFRKYDNSKLFDGACLTVSKAHEPGDTNWENIEISTNEKLKRRITTLIISMLLIGGSFCAIFFISQQQEEYRKNETDQTKVQGFSILGSVTVLIINQLLQLVIQWLADFEAFNSKTDTVISIAKKSGIAQFINTTIVQFLVNIIQNGLDIWNNGGLVNDITLLLISNAFLPAFISLLQIENIFKWLQQQLFLRKTDEDRRRYTQMQVHTMFERPQFNPAACFAGAANTLLLASFYAWIVPLGLPFSILSLILQVCVNKYKLLRRQSVPIPYGSELPSVMIDFYFEIITLFFSLGCLSFELILYKEAHPCTIAQVVISGLYYLIPINQYMDQKLNLVFNFVETLTYSDAKVQGHFATDYDRRNPILKTEAIKKYIDFVLENEQDPVKKSELQRIFYPDTKSKSQVLKLTGNFTDRFFRENLRSKKHQQTYYQSPQQPNLNQMESQDPQQPVIKQVQSQDPNKDNKTQEHKDDIALKDEEQNVNHQKDQEIKKREKITLPPLQQARKAETTKDVPN